MVVRLCAAVCVPLLQARRAAPPREQRHPRPGPPPLGPDPVSGGGGLHPLLQPVEGRQVFREGVEQHNHTTVCQDSSFLSSSSMEAVAIGRTKSRKQLSIHCNAKYTNPGEGKLRPGGHEQPVKLLNLANQT